MTLLSGTERNPGALSPGTYTNPALVPCPGGFHRYRAVGQDRYCTFPYPGSYPLPAGCRLPAFLRPDLHQNEPLLPPDIICPGNNVITSYSIHYTKLYDFVKFNCYWSQSGSVITDEQYEIINHWRDILFNLDLIGAFENGVGFGNISIRIGKSQQFFITGSSTGDIPELEPGHYVKVSSYRNNFV